MSHRLVEYVAVVAGSQEKRPGRRDRGSRDSDEKRARIDPVGPVSSLRVRFAGGLLPLSSLDGLRRGRNVFEILEGKLDDVDRPLRGKVVRHESAETAARKAQGAQRRRYFAVGAAYERNLAQDTNDGKFGKPFPFP